MKKTPRELWEYCYSQARQINGYLNAAKVEMEGGNTTEAIRLAMEAGELITHAETGYCTEGSVYVYKMSDTMEFNVYMANGDRYEFIFPFGDNTLRNKQAEANRKQWQEFAQLLEEQAGADWKRACLFDIVATVSDDAMTHIYNTATVWEAWDKRGR